MRTAEDQRRRNSRWDQNPVLNDDGSESVVRLTARDIAIFKLLARYRYLPSDDIHAFMGGSLKALTRRLTLLSRKPNCYLGKPDQQRENADANYRPLVYELGERGSRALREQGLSFLPRTYHRNFAHELMVCRIMASIELGVCADNALRLITWPDILASENTPVATRASAAPASMPVRITVRDQAYSINLTADGWPFGIERMRGGTRSYLFFPGIEAGCATEPIEASGFERSSIYKKFIAYRAAVSQNVHLAHFGFPNFFVPFITTNTIRMNSMMRLLARVTEDRGSKMFLFKTFPAPTSFDQVGKPKGHMLTEPWQRAGFGPFTFSE